MIGRLIALLFGGGTGGIAGAIERAYSAKLAAETDAARLAADVDLARLTSALQAAEIANADRWSATSIGRFLIVLPFGAWWTAIFADSIFSFSWNVLALPPAIMDLTIWLVPAIVIGDVGRAGVRALRRR